MLRYPSKSARQKSNLDMFQESSIKQNAMKGKPPPPRKSTMCSLPTEPMQKAKKFFTKTEAKKKSKAKAKAKQSAMELAAQRGQPAGKTKKTSAPTGMPSREAWYVGKMDRKKCERLVKACMPGDFLVRRSASSESEIICVNDFGEAANFAVSYVEGALPVLYARRQFETLDDAIAHAIARSVTVVT